MNLYFLVEDGKSGHQVITQWIKLLIPFLSRAEGMDFTGDNQFVVFSGFGYPRILGTNPEKPEKNILGATIETINSAKKFDYLLIFIDGDNEGAFLRKKKVEEKISTYREKLTIPYFVFIQNICFETWLLGNRQMFPEAPTPLLQPFTNHYDISSHDPEKMPNRPHSGSATASLYHEKYLRAILKDSGHHYNKSRPAPIVMSASYIQALQERVRETPHLASLAEFFYFMENLALHPPTPSPLNI